MVATVWQAPPSYATPTIDVAVLATPMAAAAPGGTFTFTVQVTNIGDEAVTLTSLTDDVYGDIPTGPGTCGTAVGTVLQPGGAYACSYTGFFTGPAGSSQTNTVTARATGSSGAEVVGSGTALVSLTAVGPSIRVTKLANPSLLVAPGGGVNFDILLENTGTEPLTITSLTDDVYGDVTTRENSTCFAAIGQPLGRSGGPGTRYSCTFVGTFTGGAGDSQTDVVTVRATTAAGVEVTDSDDATVTLTASPTILVDKTATPESLPAPGGDFRFAIVVTNTTASALTIASLIDDVYGDLSVRGSCVTAVGTVLGMGATYDCAFTAPFTGVAGDAQTDVVTVVASGFDGVDYAGADDATVSIVAGATMVTSATPTLVLPGPGTLSDTATVTGGPPPAPVPTGTVTFTVYGPNNPTCSGTPVFTSANQLLAGTPATATSQPYTPTGPGVYNWVATYSGDAFYGPIFGSCGEPGESSFVSMVHIDYFPRGSATPSVVLGGSISDTMTFSTDPALPATGTVVFTIFGPGDPTCSGAPIFTSSAVPLSPGPPATATSPPFTPTVAGTYNWVAYYSGDANYPAMGVPCGSSDQTSVVIAPVTPTLVTQASPSVPVGGQVTDTATLSGGTGPTGTVTFRLFGPGDARARAYRRSPAPGRSRATAATRPSRTRRWLPAPSAGWPPTAATPPTSRSRPPVTTRPRRSP